MAEQSRIYREIKRYRRHLSSVLLIALLLIGSKVGLEVYRSLPVTSINEPVYCQTDGTSSYFSDAAYQAIAQALLVEDPAELTVDGMGTVMTLPSAAEYRSLLPEEVNRFSIVREYRNLLGHTRYQVLTCRYLNDGTIGLIPSEEEKHLTERPSFTESRSIQLSEYFQMMASLPYDKILTSTGAELFEVGVYPEVYDTTQTTYADFVSKSMRDYTTITYDGMVMQPSQLYTPTTDCLSVYVTAKRQDASGGTATVGSTMYYLIEIPTEEQAAIIAQQEPVEFQGYSYQWTRDGEFLTYYNDNTIYFVNKRSQVVREIPLGMDLGSGGRIQYTFSPNGERILVASVHPGNALENRIAIFTVGGQLEREVDIQPFVQPEAITAVYPEAALDLLAIDWFDDNMIYLTNQYGLFLYDIQEDEVIPPAYDLAQVYRAIQSAREDLQPYLRCADSPIVMDGRIYYVGFRSAPYNVPRGQIYSADRQNNETLLINSVDGMPMCVEGKLVFERSSDGSQTINSYNVSTGIFDTMFTQTSGTIYYFDSIQYFEEGFYCLYTPSDPALEDQERDVYVDIFLSDQRRRDSYLIYEQAKDDLAGDLTGQAPENFQLLQVAEVDGELCYFYSYQVPDAGQNRTRTVVRQYFPGDGTDRLLYSDFKGFVDDERQLPRLSPDLSQLVTAVSDEETGLLTFSIITPETDS